MTETCFSNLSEDVILHIFLKLEHDPRDWARLTCVSTKFSYLIRNIFWKNKCLERIPSIVSDLLSTSSDPPGGWASLHKLSVCCPGLFHAGVLLENSDFGLERELGPDENYQEIRSSTHVDLNSKSHPISSSSSSSNRHDGNTVTNSENCWSLFDDLYFDTVYDNSETHHNGNIIEDQVQDMDVEEIQEQDTSDCAINPSGSKMKMKNCRAVDTHLASRAWNLSREQGNKLLASRFRGDCLYICDWPGCIHTEEKRNYMLFRGIFKNFKRSRVWRTINDGNRSKIALGCAFCPCKETWDLHSAFCLRRVFGYHDDGEPVVRAYVCENGHVSGAWTDRPMYT
ncbi:F-box domain [Macleaya cordata]|uniref:F-box domain n=1 Tax=Macleaya cordata TaxID=56857 RepID=A0A200PPS9_MACCD|nr:F-box domain [Macleaya cordata]